MQWPLVRLSVLLLVGALLLGPVGGFSAANTVGESRIGAGAALITPDDFKPEACEGMSVVHLVIGDGTINGTEFADLVLGGPSDDFLIGHGGDDCLVAGGGEDRLKGQKGNDICLGGPGDDIFESSCETIYDGP